MRHPTVLAWSLAVLAVAFGVCALGLSALAGEHADPWWQSAMGLAAVSASAAVGLLVATRRHGHPVGWLLLGNALILGTIGATTAYAQYSLLEDPGALPGGEWAVLWNQSSWPLLFGVIAALALIFPEGRLISPRWRRVALASGAAVLAFLVLSFFDSEPFEAPYEEVDRPLPGLPGALAVLWPLAMLGMLAGLVAGAWALRIRFRRATGVERLQLKWLAYTAFLVPAALVVCVVGAIAADGLEDDDAFTALFFFMLAAVPTSVGVAVLRYRLYDIDRIINRTLVYGVLTLLLAGAYTRHDARYSAPRSAAGPPGPRRAPRWPRPRHSDPLRARVQDIVDRRFTPCPIRRHTADRRPSSTRCARGRAPPESVEDRAAGGPRPIPHSSSTSGFRRARSTWTHADARSVDSPRPTAVERTPVERAGVRRSGWSCTRTARQDRTCARGGRRSAAAGLAIEIAQAARGAAAPARRGRGLARADRVRRLRGAATDRARSPRRSPAAARISIGLELRHVQHEAGPAADGAVDALDVVVAEIAGRSTSCASWRAACGPAQLDDGLLPALRELAGRAPACRSR